MCCTRAPLVFLRSAYRNRRLLIAVLIGITAPTFTYAQNGTSGRNDPDTLPDRVARSALEAYNRHDVNALAAFYDTITVHEMLGDSARRFVGTPSQNVAALPDYFAKNQVHAELKQQIVSGPFVVQLYDFIENGKRTPHLDIYEVRHGKIVHEWDQGS
jgi:hypothetical protein